MVGEEGAAARGGVEASQNSILETNGEGTKTGKNPYIAPEPPAVFSHAHATTTAKTEELVRLRPDTFCH